MKVCTGKCKQLKPLSEFYLRKESKDGHMSVCKDCRRKGQIQYRLDIEAGRRKVGDPQGLEEYAAFREEVMKVEEPIWHRRLAILKSRGYNIKKNFVTNRVNLDKKELKAQRRYNDEIDAVLAEFGL
jgi:hypothetical protein